MGCHKKLSIKFSLSNAKFTQHKLKKDSAKELVFIASVTLLVLLLLNLFNDLDFYMLKEIGQTQLMTHPSSFPFDPSLLTN